MKTFIKKPQKLSNLDGVIKIAIVILITSISLAFVNTIWAVYLDSFVHSEVWVGLISAALSLISFVSYFIFIPIIEKKDLVKICSFSLFLFVISYCLFAIVENFYLILFLSVIIALANSLKLTSLGILVKNYSPKKHLSKNEGVVYTLRNIAWVVGPLIAGYLMASFGTSGVFIVSAIILAFGLFLFQRANLKCQNYKKKIDGKIIKNFFDFFSNKDRLIAYFLAGGVSLWWTLIYLFIPLEIVRSGLGNLWIGYFLFAIAIPLIIFEYPFSRWAGKNGFRKLFKIGFLFVTLISFICFYFSNLYIIMGLLVLASIGMAMVEPTIEAYFLDILKKGEEYRFYGPFNTAIDVSLIIGKVFTSILLIFLPFNFVFLLFAGFMFLFFLLSFKTKDIIESKIKHK